MNLLTLNVELVSDLCSKTDPPVPPDINLHYTAQDCENSVENAYLRRMKRNSNPFCEEVVWVVGPNEVGQKSPIAEAPAVQRIIESADKSDLYRASLDKAKSVSRDSLRETCRDDSAADSMPLSCEPPRLQQGQ